MTSISTPAIILRRVNHGDYDLIVTFFTLNNGKISMIAKFAKKSVKRFAGILELFSVLQVVCKTGRNRGLPVLQEASLKHLFSGIRSDIKKTAYAGYWVELTNKWMEEWAKQVRVYHLLQYALKKLDQGLTQEKAISILFQIKFMSLFGLSPNLSECGICGIPLEKIENSRIIFDIIKGGLVCKNCSAGSSRPILLSKGTIKQLFWIENNDLKKAERIKFTPFALQESEKFLEAFVPYHLGKEPRSLKFLRQIR